MKAQVPGPPTVTSSPILNVNSPASTQATSSLSRCRWKRLAVPAGKVSSNIMMLSLVSRPRSFKAKERAGVGESKCFPPPAGTTKPFVAVMLLSSCDTLRSFGHALVGELLLCLVVLAEREAHAAHHIGRLRELDVRVLDDFEPVAPRIEEIEERAFDKERAGGLRQLDDGAAVVDDKAEMPLLDAINRVVGHQGHVDELVAHVDEGVALALAAQFEIEDLAVPSESLVDVADLDRDMIDTNESRLLSFGHDRPPTSVLSETVPPENKRSPRSAIAIKYWWCRSRNL